jgi:hypothetical protein
LYVEFEDGLTAEDDGPPHQFYSKTKRTVDSMIGALLGQNEDPINGSGELESYY